MIAAVTIRPFRSSYNVATTSSASTDSAFPRAVIVATNGLSSHVAAMVGVVICNSSTPVAISDMRNDSLPIRTR